MTQKIVNTIQWTSIVVGITGMSLDKIIPVNPLASRILMICAIGAFAILVIVQLFYRDPNQFVGKMKVDLAWRTLLTRASSSVDVFAGDVSWAKTNEIQLIKQTQAGVAVRVLCRWPTTELLFDHVRSLFKAGVHVRYYTENTVKVRGLVIDGAIGLDNATALTVVKTPIQRVALNKGEIGTDNLFDYEARRYLPVHDKTYISILYQLFDSIWETLPKGLILHQANCSPEQLRTILSQIPHYGAMAVGSITIKEVPIVGLYSCCRTVKAQKVDKVSSLIEGYEQFELQPFEACWIEASGERRLILPPIAEQLSDGRVVLIDGMHRIYRLATHTDTQQVTCVVIDAVAELPSDPIPFTDVRVSATKQSRINNFPNYKHDNFRDIKIIDRYLARAQFGRR